MGVRVGIDVGENIVVQYGWSTNSYTVVGENSRNEIDNRYDENAKSYIGNKEVMITTNDSNDIKSNLINRKPHLDILGYTTSIAAKMTGFTAANQIIIGQSVYDILDSVNKNKFKKVYISKDDWNFVNPSTGNVLMALCNRRPLGITNISHIDTS
jgi:adenylate cyclase